MPIVKKMKSNNFFPKGVKEFFSDATQKAVEARKESGEVKDFSLISNIKLLVLLLGI